MGEFWDLMAGAEVRQVVLVHKHCRKRSACVYNAPRSALLPRKGYPPFKGMVFWGMRSVNIIVLREY